MDKNADMEYSDYIINDEKLFEENFRFNQI
jgi:hypothetical protein